MMANQSTIFGLEHSLYFVFSNLIGIVALVLILKYCKTEKQRNIVMWAWAGILLAAAVIHRMILAFHPDSYPYGGWQYLIPSSFCSMTSFALSLSVLLIKNKNHAFFHWLIYVSLLGGIITKFYPDWLFRDGFGHPATLIALLHHTISFYLSLLLIFQGRWKPNIKKWHYAYLGAAMYILLGYFLIEVLNVYASMGVRFYISGYVCQASGYMVRDCIYCLYGCYDTFYATMSRGRYIVLNWHWFWPVTFVFGAYHFAFMGIWTYVEYRNKYKCKPCLTDDKKDDTMKHGNTKL